MSQSRFGSIAETLFNTAIGFSINYTANVIFLPSLWDKSHVAAAAFHIGMLFTVISVVRGFGIRRLFNHPPFATWIERWNKTLEVKAEWLMTRLASVTSRVRSVARKTTSLDTTTVTPTASPQGALTSSLPPTDEKPFSATAEPGPEFQAAPWNCS